MPERARSLRSTLPHDIRWVDHARLGSVDLLAPPGARKEQSWQQLFWNTSVKRLLLLGSAPIDQFDAKHLKIAGDGTLLVDGRPDRRPLLVQTYASTVQLSGVERVRHELIFDLYRPVGTPRLRLLAADASRTTGRATGCDHRVDEDRRTLELVLALPAHTQVTPSSLPVRESSAPSACIPGNASHSASTSPPGASGACTSARRGRATSATAPSACAPTASASAKH